MHNVQSSQYGVDASDHTSLAVVLVEFYDHYRSSGTKVDLISNLGGNKWTSWQVEGIATHAWYGSYAAL
jgi:hypothetical protein